MIQLGRIQPSVAQTAPPMPATVIPTNVAEFTAIVPGVICEMVIRLSLIHILIYIILSAEILILKVRKNILACSVNHGIALIAVSYTHLDVYKRQA